VEFSYGKVKDVSKKGGYKMRKIKQDKKGVMGIILFFLILFSILIIGFTLAVVVGVVDFSSDTLTPIMEEIGMVEDANVSQAAHVTVGVVNGFVQSAPWLLALGYVGALVFSIVFVVAYNSNPNPAFIGLYLGFILLLILGSIIISNAYEEIYNGTDEIATRLQDNVAMSYLILYSPFILTVIAFITGIYLFAGRQNENVGGYGI